MISKKQGDLAAGESISMEVTFDAQLISSMAALAGDTNPLHHDVAHAQSTQYGGLIASGAHTSMLMLGLAARFVAGRGTCVGREFRLRLEAPIRAGDTAVATWEVLRIEPGRTPGRQKIHLHGCLRRSDGIVAVDVDGVVISLPDEA